MLQLGISYTFIKNLVIIELVLLVLLIIVTYVLGIIFQYQTRYNLYLQNKIRNFLQKALLQKTTICIKKNYMRTSNKHKLRIRLHKKTLFMQLFIPVFKEFNTEYANNPSWTTLRDSIVKDFLHVYARKYAVDRNWILRLYSAEIFTLDIRPEDEEIILKLIHDEVILVYIQTVKVAIKLGSEKALLAVIERITKENWVMEMVYLDQFGRMNMDSLHIIEEILLQSQNEKIRAICYQILLKFPPIKSVWHEKDVFSTNYNLSASALKYYVHCKEESALSTLVMFLTHSDWRLRFIAVHRIGFLEAKSEINKIAERVSDKEWWVEIAAAIVLQQFGRQGVQMLREINPTLIDLRINLNKYLHHILW